MTSHRRSPRLFPSLGPSLAVATILLCATAASADLQLAPCALPGFDTEGRCGQLNVRVDRSDPASETLALRVVELPAASDEVRSEPLFYLVGGPGRAATSGVEFFSDSLRGIQAHHRVVLLERDEMTGVVAGIIAGLLGVGGGIRRGIRSRLGLGGGARGRVRGLGEQPSGNRQREL